MLAKVDDVPGSQPVSSVGDKFRTRFCVDNFSRRGWFLPKYDSEDRSGGSVNFL